MGWSRSLVALGLALAVLAGMPGCRGSSQGKGRPAPVAASDPELLPGGANPEESFVGIREALPLDGGALLSWTRVTEEVEQQGARVRVPRTGIEYWVYHSALPLVFDETEPALVVADQGQARLQGLANGIVVWITVRARDAGGFLGKNAIALPVQPAPVRFLAPGSPGQIRDGSSPERAFAGLAEAFAASPRPCALYIGEGTLQGEIVLPAGVSLAGGFGPDFDPAGRDARRYVTRLEPAGGGVLIRSSGWGFSLVTGLFLEGQDRAAAGIHASDTLLAVRNTTIARAAGPGVSLVGDPYTESRIDGSLAFLRLLGNRGAGLFAGGLTGLWIQECLVRRNGSEGVKARELSVNPEGDLVFRLDRCRMEANASMGVEVGLVGGPAPRGDQGPGRARVELNGCLIRDNGQEGARAVADPDRGSGLDGRILVCSSDVVANGGSGILVQSSDLALVLVHGNRVSANRGAAGITVGAGSGGTTRVCNNAVFGNYRDGIRVLDTNEQRRVEVYNNDIAANGLTGLSVGAEDTAVLSNTSVWNKVDVDAPWAAHTLRLSGTGGPGVFSGNPGYLVFPVGIQFTTSFGTEGMVHVPWPGVTAPGEFIEIADDGVVRSVLEVTAAGILFEPPLGAPKPPGSAVFIALDREGVHEDLRLSSSSPALLKGSDLLPDRLGGGSTCGFTGGPLGVPQTGRTGDSALPDLPFLGLQLIPPPGTRMAEVDRFTVIAGRTLDETTVTAANVLLLNATSLAPISTRINVFGTDRDRFVISGFPQLDHPVLLVVSREVKDAQGVPLSLPVLAFYPK